jgi:hypothetical protein
MRWLVMLLVVAGCGPSNAQIKTAKTAQYTASVDTIYDIALAVAQENYNVVDAERGNGRFITAPQFYSAEGGRQSAGADDMVMVGAGSVQVQLLVEVVAADGKQVAVTVTPRTFQVVSGSPKPRELAPDDPSLPPWVLGRADALQVAIYERAKGYASSP